MQQIWASILYRPKYTKKDANHAQVIADCRDAGMYVWDLSDLGGEVLDTLVFWRGKCVPVEIKQPGHAEDFTKGERKSIGILNAMGIPVIVATCVEDIINGWH